MITRTIGTKKYTIDRLNYHILGNDEHLAIIFKVEDEDRTYYYQMDFNEDELKLVMDILENNFADYIVQRIESEHV